MPSAFRIAARLPVALLLIATAIGTGCIVSTYSTLSSTWDEPTHLSAGLEFLQDGRYALQTENPPVARVATAIIPFVLGARLPPPAERAPGFMIGPYYRTANYIRNVTESRVATLLFFWLCVAFTWQLGGGRRDPWVAALAAGAVATLPPIVAHAGFATTDVGFLASFLLALIAFRRVLERPNAASAALCGAAVGLAVATKFSTLVFLPPAVAAVLALYAWPRRGALVSWTTACSVGTLLGIGIPVAAIVLWASYGLHVGRLSDLPPEFGTYGTMPQTGWPAMIKDWRIPGHEFVHGLLYLQSHTIAGHRSTLFDEFSQRGFLLFYPVVLATKTPLPFILMAALGLFGLFWRRNEPDGWWFRGLALGAAAVLAVAMTSPINLGVRHVLVVYPLVALATAFGLVRWGEQAGTVPLAVGVVCVALQATLLGMSAPNQITYFNVFAGAEPAYISSDSDFDWGQDLLAMEKYFQQHLVPELYVALAGTANPCALQVPRLRGLPTMPVTGWIAVSERFYRLNRGVIRRDPCLPTGQGNQVAVPPGWLNWLKQRQPDAIVGRTIRLYRIE